MKCPNPECNAILNSPYHTICPVCAEPFPIDMLYKEPRETNVRKVLLIIFAFVVIALLILLFVSAFL